MSFNHIFGQEKPIRILKSRIQQNRLAGAYLFLGPDGVGKRMAAIALGKTLNCLQNELEACGRCSSCFKIDKAGHPDLHFISEPDNAIKIEAIRQLQREINLKPYEGKKKVFIIDNAHNLTAEAANALLKVLEEPPPESILILITAKPALLFKTVISRCQIIKFYPLKREELAGILNKVYRLDNQAAHFLAYFSEGRIGNALKLKDAGIMEDKNRIIDAFSQSGNFKFGGSLTPTADSFKFYLDILAGWFRDIYLLKIGAAHLEIINLDRRQDLLKIMSRYTLAELNEIMKSISDASLRLKQNINIKLLLSNLRMELWKR